MLIHSLTEGKMDDCQKALKADIERINQLCVMVNSYAIQLGLGKKVNADDWTDAARDALTKANHARQTQR
jgi:methanogenic corrinoid protein MtbC1